MHYCESDDYISGVSEAEKLLSDFIFEKKAK
jgi:hypothetical protein